MKTKKPQFTEKMINLNLVSLNKEKLDFILGLPKRHQLNGKNTRIRLVFLEEEYLYKPKKFARNCTHLTAEELFTIAKKLEELNLKK